MVPALVTLTSELGSENNSISDKFDRIKKELEDHRKLITLFERI